MSDSVSGSLDAVFKKLETEVATLEQKKNALETEVNTLSANKDTVAQEVANLQELQREEEKKLGEYKLKTVDVEQESLNKIAVATTGFDMARVAAETAKSLLEAKEQDLKDRESMVERTTATNTERAAALTAQAADLEAREKAVTQDREALTLKQEQLNALSAEIESKKGDVDGKLALIESAQAGVNTSQQAVAAQAAEVEKQREQVNSRQTALDETEVRVKGATRKMEQFYAAAKEIALKVQIGVANEDKPAVEEALNRYFTEIGYVPQSAA